MEKEKMHPTVGGKEGMPIPGRSMAPPTFNPTSNEPVQRSLSLEKGSHYLMDDELQKGREANGHWNYTGCQKNYALSPEAGGKYAHSDEGGHAERNLLMELLPYRNKGDEINIHTERAPCGSCYDALEKMHDGAEGTDAEFDMNISYTVDYPGAGDSKEKLHQYYMEHNEMPARQGA